MPSPAHYRKPENILRYRHDDMRHRVEGKPIRHGVEQYPWLGMEISTREEFVAWGLTDPEFVRLYDLWAADDFARRTAPSCHRIDRSRGYTIDNIKFMPHAEKSRLHLAQGHKTQAAKKALKEAA
jgi:hypothetical protein